MKVNEELWKRFLSNEDMVINCRTEEEANEFLELCESKNITWCGKEKATEHNFWMTHKEDTCYDCDIIGSYLGGISFGGADWFKAHSHKVILFTDLMEKENSKQELLGTIIVKGNERLTSIEPNGNSKTVRNEIPERILKYYRNGNITTCVLTCDGVKGVGVAQCHERDEYTDEGRVRAELRAKADFYTKLSKKKINL